MSTIKVTTITHTPIDKMAAISQATFSDAFSRMKNFVFWLEFHWSLFLRVQSRGSQHWFRLWLGAEQATSHYLDQCWLSSWPLTAVLAGACLYFIRYLQRKVACHFNIIIRSISPPPPPPPLKKTFENTVCNISVIFIRPQCFERCSTCVIRL